MIHLLSQIVLDRARYGQAIHDGAGVERITYCRRTNPCRRLDVALLQKPVFRGPNHPTLSPPLTNCSRRELTGSNHETILMVRPTFWITPITLWFEQTSFHLVGSLRFSPGVEERPPGSTTGENDHRVPHLNCIKFWNILNWISSFSRFLRSTVLLYRKYENICVSFRTFAVLWYSCLVLSVFKICPWSFVPLNPKPKNLKP
jgi:hypothetical protein